MLPATLKLCCGISHQHLRKMAGLKRTAVAAIGHDLTRLMVNGSHSLFARVPDYLHRMLRRNIGLDKAPPSSVSMKYSLTELFYVNQGEATRQRALEMLQQQDGWQTEIQKASGDCVLSKGFPRIGKVFRAEAILDYPADALYYQLFEKLVEMNDWNPAVSKVEILQRIGKHTLVTREVTAETLGNLIGQRDFVSVRHCWRQGSAIYLVGTATQSELMPPRKGLVRAEAGLTCIILRPFENDSRRTHFTWLLNMDLKGWIPKSIINQVMSQSQADFIKHLRQRLSVSSAQD
ncbi:steroidogenic acute regulatory protein, mitochondrial-like [Ambystoma mexicanum]|uniref:steroidogenic acute regulatory protein, mitochondrial-like n=1 Tax=Ambystoma mexicanum TaxID=8296 RepID=UPI0037E7B980